LTGDHNQTGGAVEQGSHVVNDCWFAREGHIIEGRQDPTVTPHKTISFTFGQSLEQAEQQLNGWILNVREPI